jgi:hypothetical protein
LALDILKGLGQRDALIVGFELSGVDALERLGCRCQVALLVLGKALLEELGGGGFDGGGGCFRGRLCVRSHLGLGSLQQGTDVQ